jgi:iron(III) transport system ATP-binding protein
MADRIALLKDGELVQVGTAEHIYKHPISLFAAGFFSELDVFDTVVFNRHAATPLGAFATQLAEGSKVAVAIRLGDIEITRDETAIPARILSRRFLGETEMMQLAVSGLDAPVSTRQRCGVVSPLARDIRIFVTPDRALVFERSNESA